MRNRHGIHFHLTIAVVAIAAGCSRVSSIKGNAADAQSQSPSSENSTPWAANANDVARFSDEIPFGPDAIVTHDKTPVRKSPKSGEILATLPAGTDVVKLSTHNGEDLVCFDDPTDGGLHLVGWVAQSALAEPTPPPAPPPLPSSSAVVDADAPQPSTPNSPDNPNPTPGGGHHHRKPHGQPKR